VTLPDPQAVPGAKAKRRQFLKKAALATAGGLAGAGGLNAVSPLLLPGGQVFEPNLSHWAKALPPPCPALAADTDADVVVIGGGFTGLSAACHLRRAMPGRRLVLLEAKTCGNGASGRNGAMVMTMTEDRFMELSGDAALDRRLYALTAGNLDAVAALAAQTGIDCDLERTGTLQVLAGEDEVAAARRFAVQAQAAGLPFTFWDRARTAAAIGTSCYHGALFDPGGGQVHPGKLVALWKAAALAAGVEIYDATPVTGIEEGPVHRIETARGQVVRAPVLVLATNAYSPRLGYLRRAVAPIYDYNCITPVLSAAQLALLGWRTRIPFNDTRTETYYAGLTRDNRIHFGGGPVDHSFNDGLRTPSAAPRRHAALHREFTRLFPALADMGFESSWGGWVDMSLDRSPAVGRIGRHGNVYYGIGYSGQGVNLSMIFGGIIADLITGRRQDWSWLPFLDRLPPYVPNEPFRWLGVEAYLAATRLSEG